MEGKNLMLIRYLLMLMLISCSKEKQINYYEAYSTIDDENIVNRERTSYVLFSKNTNQQICLIKPYEISLGYKKSKTAIKYEDFFNNVLYQKTLIEVDSMDHICFKLDYNIKVNYLKLKTNDFLDRYTKKSNINNNYLINNTLKDNEILNVAYFLFKEGFKITYNDYLGVYYAKRLK